MTANNQNSLDDLLNDHDSKVAAFNTKHWDPSQRKVAERWWNEIRSETIAAINKTIMEDVLASLPEEKAVIAQDFDEDNFHRSAVINANHKGYNQAISDMQQALAKKYGRADND